MPAAIATWSFGEPAIAAGREILAGGGSALDAIEAGVNAVELDPEVMSVGYGGLPNAEGAIELDAMIMSGPTHQAGAVAALRGIATPISVARRVMEAGPHPFLSGDGALAFARRMGFRTRDLLTPAARERLEAWRVDPRRKIRLAHDTVGMVALDAAGDLAVGCSTSGLPFKHPGRIADSPIIGSGAYCDNQVGGAAATGDGDAMMRFCPSFSAVEAMRAGQSAQEACEGALRRMLEKGVEAQAAVIALDRVGNFGAAIIGRDEFPHAVWDGARSELRRVPALSPPR